MNKIWFRRNEDMNKVWQYLCNLCKVISGGDKKSELWYHVCPIERSKMGVQKNKNCNWCGVSEWNNDE